MNRRIFSLMGLILFAGGASPVFADIVAASSDALKTALTLDEAITEAAAHNPAVHAARAQYDAARHQIDQAYTPADPSLNLSFSQTPDGLTYAQTRGVGVSESLQFPGKALLQGGQAQRAAEIAKLTYMAAVRDATAQVKAAYYQTLLDSASVRINAENKASIADVLEVARIAYTANQNAQTDLISAQFALSLASQTVLTSQVTQANDEASLNQLLDRRPETPILLTSDIELKAFEVPLEAVKEKALTFRQEVLEAALTEKNAQSALKLAWMELLPDYNLSWMRNNYPSNSINAPRSTANDPGVLSAQASNPSIQTSASHDFTTGISFNLPVFFWFRQKEDIRAAINLLDAVRQNRKAIEIQTETNAVQLYRSTQLAYKNVLLNRDVLVPLANQNLRVALISYQSKKIDFTTLANILQSLFASRINYLVAANQFLAGKVALEQIMGGPLAQ